MDDFNTVLNDIASTCIYGDSFVYDILSGFDYDNIYLPQIDRPMSARKLDGYKRLAKGQIYYSQNPVKFIEDFFRIQLVDSQAFIFQMSWTKPFVIINASRAYGKSMFEVLFAMAKQMLSSKAWNCYIASGSADQSATTFRKLEEIANNRISSLRGSTGEIFAHEVVIPNASGTGFSHNPSGFTYSLYNGSMLKTLSSNIDRGRGARSDCVLFDEVGFLPSEMLRVYAAFCAVSESFITGFDENGNPINVARTVAMPRNIPHQLIHVSSASTVDTEYYRMFKDYSKQMICGNKNYFVANIDCELVMKPTIHNIPTVPALTRAQVESEMRTNPEKARREYYCQFTTEAGADAIVKRGVITRNEETRKPVHANDGERKYILAYDPARQRDNSVVIVGEIYDSPLPDGKMEKKCRIVNLVNLLDVGKKIKSPMQTPEQVDYLRKMILDYNGGADGYANIIGVYVDAGSGGGGPIIADILMQNWIDKAGVEHRGFIDPEYSEDYVKKFPDAVRDKLHMMNPSAFKSVMYEAMIEMLNQDKISFTATYDHKGYLTVFDVDQALIEKETAKITEELRKKKVTGKEFDRKLKEELDKLQSVKTKIIKLDWRDEIALANIDALKEEAVNMIRKKRESGKDSFELTPEKANRLHDDRIYTCAMLGYGLLQERRKDMLNRPKQTKTDFSQLFTYRKPKKVTRF